MDTKVIKEDLIYLYCITDKVPNLKETENLVTNSYFIYYQGLYAVVHKVKESEFAEENLKRNLADFEWIKVRVTIHEKVIEVIMKKAGVIPFKFATLFNAEDNLKAMFSKNLREFRDILRKLKYKEEWGVKIYCDLEKLKEVIIREDGEILDIDKGINGSTAPGRAYLLKKKKEELLNIAANKKLNEYGEMSFARLREMPGEARINKLLSKEVTERKEEMILNSAFLIDKNKVADFLNTVEGLKTRYADKGLFFDCTGPWPPYNFCDLLKEEA
jgi:hypothetical protein